MNPLHNKVLLPAAGVLLFAALVVYRHSIVSVFERSAAPEQLVQQALESTSPARQESAAVRLADSRSTGPEHLPRLRRVLRQSETPQVRAACIVGLGSHWDYQSMDLLLESMEDESPLVRGRAGSVVRKMLGRDYLFRANDPEETRAQALKHIRRDWQELRGSALLEDFKRRRREQS